MTELLDPHGEHAAALEHEYNARVAIPEHVDILAGWQDRSAAFRARAGGRLDMRCVGRGRPAVDYFTAAGIRAPLLIYAHGGYWQRGDRKDYSFLAAPFVARGVNVALVGYDLCPAVTLGDIVEQLRVACAWLWRQAATLGHDRGRIYIGGHSAGAHLAAVMLATEWPALDNSLPLGLLRGGFAVSGVYDLSPLRATSINDLVGLDADAARRWSPLWMIPRDGVSLLLAVGGDESAAFRQQTAALAQAWRPVITASVQVPGANHFTVLESLADGQGLVYEHAWSLIAD
jgi:arylformamidase